MLVTVAVMRLRFHELEEFPVREMLASHRSVQTYTRDNLAEIARDINSRFESQRGIASIR